MRVQGFLKAGSRWISGLGSSRRCSAHQIVCAPLCHISLDEVSVTIRAFDHQFNTGSAALDVLLCQRLWQRHGWSFKNQTRPMSVSAASQVDIKSESTSESVSAQDESPKQEIRPVVYRGPMSETLRKVKILSLTTCCLSIMTAPVIIFLTSPQLASLVKGGVAATVMMLSASTTAALHWFVGPYVHKLTWNPGSGEIEVEVVTWMATYERRKFHISDVQPPRTNRPFATFAVKGKLYFVDPEKIHNKDLYKALTTFKH